MHHLQHLICRGRFQIQIFWGYIFAGNDRSEYIISSGHLHLYVSMPVCQCASMPGMVDHQ